MSAMGKFELELSWPPSVNHVWRKAGHRTILAGKAREFRIVTASKVATARAEGRMPRQTITEPISVSMLLMPPDNRRRDVDNSTKAVLDALTHAGVWRDDSLVRSMKIYFGSVCHGGAVKLSITPMETQGGRKND